MTGKWLAVVAIGASIAVAAATGWVLLGGSGGKAPELTVAVASGKGGTQVREVSDVDTSWLEAFSTAASPVYDASSEARGPYELRFPLPPEARRGRLVAASTSGGDAWSLYRGRVEAGRVVFEVPHLSPWQLRLLRFDPPVRLPSFDDFERRIGARASPPVCGHPLRDIWLRRQDRDGILLGPCVGARGSRAVLRVANGRAAAQVIETPVGTNVSVRGRSLPEAIGDAAHRILPNRDLRLFPGTGQAAIAFGSIPARANFKATSGAGVLEAALLVASRGRDRGATNQVIGAMDCMWGLYDELEFAYRSPGNFEDALQLVFGACGETLADAFSVRALSSAGFLLGAPKVLYGLWDAGRSFIDDEASTELSATPPGHRPLVTPAASGRPGDSCGHVEAIFPAGASAIAVEVGVLEGSVSCDTARDAVRAYITATGPCDNEGAGTCWRVSDGWECVAPTAGSYPVTVSCTGDGVRLAALDSDVLPLTEPEPCGTAPGTEPPGPFDIESNFRCQAAQAIASTQFEDFPLTPFVCDYQSLGYEASRHICRFGPSEVRFISGV